MAWHFEHKKTGWTLDIKDITQGDLETYFKRYREGRADSVSGSEQNGLTVRAAAQAGWITSPAAGDVAGMPPNQVAWIAGKIDQVYLELTTIPPED